MFDRFFGSKRRDKNNNLINYIILNFKLNENYVKILRMTTTVTSQSLLLIIKINERILSQFEKLYQRI